MSAAVAAITVVLARFRGQDSSSSFAFCPNYTTVTTYYQSFYISSNRECRILKLRRKKESFVAVLAFLILPRLMFVLIIKIVCRVTYFFI